MLERVAVHQTRLRAPGLGLDAKGVALGARGLVLLPSLDRLVAFLALYTRGGSFEDVLRTLAVEVVRSRLGAREITVSFASDGCDRMDRVAEIARLSGGYTFTGTSRHFVQYRDALAPFGYDVPQILATDAALVLYHGAFTQAYEVERAIDVAALLLRLEPHPDPSTTSLEGPRWLVAEEGLGPALIHYLVRSDVAAEVGLAEWPPESAFDDAPTRRYLFRIPALPARQLPLLASTPGLTMYLPAAEGVAVELGFRHPVHLRACPVFPAEGLVLFRGGHREPLVLPRLPALGDIGALARVDVRPERALPVPRVEGGGPSAIAMRLRLLPTTEPYRSVTATWVRPEELPLLRHIAYVLAPSSLRRARIAITREGAFLHHDGGIEGIPVGELFRALRPGLYVPAAYDVAPAVSPDVLFRALGAPAGQMLFLRKDGTALGVPSDAFVPLEAALLQAEEWAPLDAVSLAPILEHPLAEVSLGPLGLRPMRDVAPAEPEPGA